LFLLTLVSVSALGWFGWKVLEQEKLVETQRSQERLEQAADRIASSLRSTLAETGERLNAWQTASPPEGSTLLLLTENGLTVRPQGRLLYYPFASPDTEADSGAFAEQEMFEFVQAQPLEALHGYQRLAGSKDAAMRGGALLRMARVLRRLGRMEEARAAYERLATVAGVNVAGVPAELIARYALGDRDALRRDLAQGRWHLTRGQFAFYWSQVTAGPPPVESEALSELTARVWESRHRNTGVSGQETAWTSSRPYLVIWRGGPERRAVMLAKPETFLSHIVPVEDTQYAVVDAEGHLLAGKRAVTGRAAIRTGAEGQLPWTIYVSSTTPLSAANLVSRQRFLLLGISVMVLFLIFGTYFIGRAIRREAEVLRMQSDFVSAVSHEFRSPLTTMRQLSEILALGRIPSEDRRQLYYDTLVSETTRLQRVVEALLNFGRMEAGARQYHFQEIDAATLVRRVVSEFEQQLAGSGRHIEVNGVESLCIDADPDAISVALRNLLDNAIKYSPGQLTVWVEWGMQNDYVAIQVRDHGLGIADAEKKTIFQKFVRGTAARASNVKGSGVGLAMVRHIVAAHGGVVKLASKTGEGSTFTMLLPIAERT